MSFVFPETKLLMYFGVRSYTYVDINDMFKTSCLGEKTSEWVINHMLDESKYPS